MLESGFDCVMFFHLIQCSLQAPCTRTIWWTRKVRQVQWSFSHWPDISGKTQGNKLPKIVSSITRYFFSVKFICTFFSLLSYQQLSCKQKIFLLVPVDLEYVDEAKKSVLLAVIEIVSETVFCYSFCFVGKLD